MLQLVNIIIECAYIYIKAKKSTTYDKGTPGMPLMQTWVDKVHLRGVQAAQSSASVCVYHRHKSDCTLSKHPKRMVSNGQDMGQPHTVEIATMQGNRVSHCVHGDTCAGNSDHMSCHNDSIFPMT